MNEELIEKMKQWKREEIETSLFLGAILGLPVGTIVTFITTGRFDWKLLLVLELIVWTIFARKRIVFEVKRIIGKETGD